MYVGGSCLKQSWQGELWVATHLREGGWRDGGSRVGGGVTGIREATSTLSLHLFDAKVAVWKLALGYTWKWSQ